MAKRSNQFRDDILELDDYRCQICGFDGHEEEKSSLLHVHHIEPRGMGGVASRDTIENGITLCSRCHRIVEDGAITIKKWNRTDTDNGLELAGYGFKPWFYVKKDKELLEQSIVALTGVASSAAMKARLVANVWENFMLLGAASPKQLISEIGLDPNEAEKEFEVISFFDQNSLIWPDGVNLAKAELVMKAVKDIPETQRQKHTEKLQLILNIATTESYSNIEERLMQGGYVEAKNSAGKRRNFYIRMPREAFLEYAVVCLGNDEQIMIDDEEMISIKVDKFFRPLKKWGEKLMIENGLLDARFKVEELGGDNNVK